LMVLSLPFLGYSFLSYIVTGISGRTLPNIFVPAIFIWILLGIVLLFCVLRNISFYPFSLLAP
jgi:flagellar biosynthesis protein FliR